MIRFHTNSFRNPEKLDTWLNSFSQQGFFVKIVGYAIAQFQSDRIVNGKQDMVLVTILVADKDGMPTKKTLGESQPEEFEEPAIIIDNGG